MLLELDLEDGQVSARFAFPVGPETDFHELFKFLVPHSFRLYDRFMALIEAVRVDLSSSDPRKYTVDTKLLKASVRVCFRLFRTLPPQICAEAALFLFSSTLRTL